MLAVKAFSQTPTDGRRISKNFTGQPLSFVLTEIGSGEGINFIYSDKLVDGLNVTCRIENLPVENAVKKILNRFDISYEKFPNDTYVLFHTRKTVTKNFIAEVVNETPPSRNEDETLAEPKLLSKIKLEYPPEALKHNIEGNVKVYLLITKEGNVLRTEVVQTSGFAVLDSSAVDYSKRLKFIPAQATGQPKYIWISMLFKYFLENK